MNKQLAKKLIATMCMGMFMTSALAVMPVSETHGTMTANTSGTSTTSMTSAQRGQCMADSLEKRDTAIISALDVYGQAMKVNLTTRKDGLKALYVSGDTEGRKDKRKAVWSAFSTATKSAANDLRTSRKSAWDQHSKDAKACGVKVSTEKMETVATPMAY